MYRVVRFAIFFCLMGSAPVFGGGLIIGFTNVQAVNSYSQSLMDQIGQFRFFFSHASVGGNMIDGLNDLNGADPNRFKLVTVSDNDTPPTTPVNGRVYEYNRDNPGWQTKMELFTNYVRRGWRYPKINIAIDKLCFIDPDADVNYYIGLMSGLETNFPETLIVYMTIPLMTSSDSDNYDRNVYNDYLRGWVTTNGRVLFDVADIEAHDTNGTLYTFSYSGKTCQRLYDGFTTDGGHLDDADGIGRQQVAKGFYALCGALLSNDRDKDGLSDGQELIAGMCPTNGTSVFQFSSATHSSITSVFTIQWPSATNRFYRLQRLTNLLNAASATDLLTNAPGTPPMNTYTDNYQGAGPCFYRVNVRQ